MLIQISTGPKARDLLLQPQLLCLRLLQCLSRLAHRPLNLLHLIRYNKRNLGNTVSACRPICFENANVGVHTRLLTRLLLLHKSPLWSSQQFHRRREVSFAVLHGGCVAQWVISELGPWPELQVFFEICSSSHSNLCTRCR